MNTTTSAPPPLDTLPPHSTEAEQGVLGCILLDPIAALPRARKRLREPEGEEFYDLRHREIWLTLGRMFDDLLEGRGATTERPASGGIDLITVQQRLRDYGKLDDVGGLPYLASLQDATPEAGHLEHYLKIVVEQYTARKLIALCTTAAARARQYPAEIQRYVHELQDDAAVVARLATAPEETSRMYLKPAEMGDEFFQRWCGRSKGVHGLPLPALAFGDFPFLIRLGELTLFEAETKMGKSTLASYIVLHLLQHGLRAVLDSREVHYVDTMRTLTTQLTGSGSADLCMVGEEQARGQGYVACECARCAASMSRFRQAVGWLQPRVMINRTTGIKHWRDILDAFHELAQGEDGYHLFVLDSLMRIGIADDDYTQQSQCIAALATFCIDTKSHLFLINHQNKGDGDFRKRSSGSHKVAANAHNICSVIKNEKKFEELAPWLDKLKDKEHRYSYEEFRQDAGKILAKWDAKFFVHAQRTGGARQNAARELWFLKRALQYFDHRHPRPETPVNWLEKWDANDQAHL